MKRFVVTLVIVISLGVCAAIPSLITVRGQNPNKFRRVEKSVAGQYIVVLNNDADPDKEAMRIARDYNGDRSNGHTFRRALKGFSIRMSEESAARLSNDPRVDFVEEDGEVTASTTQTGATWGLDRIDQRDLPLDGNYNYDETGTGVTAYIITLVSARRTAKSRAESFPASLRSAMATERMTVTVTALMCRGLWAARLTVLPRM